ncbi:MAG: B12-binding domain-containing radical SAM protein [Gammaproteobacteria bacterium]|nr:B12-binding domain-containing radical SAM protein [Gammaproteobacteria bacterium]
MNILLINPFQYFNINRHLHRHYPIPAVTLPYLASFIPEEHEVQIIDEAFETIEFDTPADLVGITTLSVNAHRAYGISEEFRKRGKKVIMGGAHVSAEPDEAIQYCDAVAIGNAEYAMPKIIEDAKNNQLKNFYRDLEPSFIPDKITGYVSSKWQTSVMASRGCELNCDFCSMQNIFGKFYIQRNSNSTLQDIDQVDTPIISFVDDNFYGASRASQAYYDEILARIKEQGKSWMAQVRLPILRKDDVLKKFRDSNCVAVFVGFESINPANRAAMGKQKVDQELYLQQIEKIHSYGIGVIGSFIFGFDEDTPETIRETVDFCIGSRMEMTAFSVLTPYPGTNIYKQMKQEGRLLSSDWRLYDSDKVLFTPKHFEPEDLEQQVLWAAKQLYSTSSIIKRMRFGMNYDTFRHYLMPNLLRKYSLLRM